MTDNNVLQAKWIVIPLRYQGNKTKLSFSFISLTLIHYMNSRDFFFFLPFLLFWIMYICMLVSLWGYVLMNVCVHNIEKGYQVPRTRDTRDTGGYKHILTPHIFKLWKIVLAPVLVFKISAYADFEFITSSLMIIVSHAHMQYELIFCCSCIHVFMADHLILDSLSGIIYCRQRIAPLSNNWLPITLCL